MAALVVGAFVLGWFLFRPADSGPVTTGAEPQPTVPTPNPSPVRPGPAPEPPALETPAESESESIAIEGGGDGNSAPFDLAGGDYLATVRFGANCTYFIDLEDVGRDIRLRHKIGSALDAQTQENFLYAVSPGRYFILVTSGPAPRCPWSVRLESQ